LKNVERWFQQIRERAAFHPAFVQWMPAGLAAEMRENGARSWDAVRELL
jgi:hypothetical protein